MGWSLLIVITFIVVITQVIKPIVELVAWHPLDRRKYHRSLAIVELIIQRAA